MTDAFSQDADLRACADLVRRADPDRFAATMAAPVPARLALFPLYAFNVEVTRAPWVTDEPMIAEMRLQWWRDVLDEIAGGGTVRRHEVATPLARVLDPAGAEILDALVAARRWDVYRESHADDAALRAYLDATGGGLMVVAARLLGDRDGQAARALGRAAGCAAYLQAVPGLVERNRIPLIDGTHAGVRALVRRGLEDLSLARRGRRRVPRRARPALIAGASAGPILRAAMREPSRVGDGTLAPSEVRLRFGRAVMALTGRF